MTLYLSDCAFKPLFLLISLLMLPSIGICLILMMVDFRVELIFPFLFFLIAYSTLIILIFHLSNNKKYFVNITGEQVTIRVPNHKDNIELSCDNIICMSYYKLSSVRSWFLLYNYVTPQAVYLTYMLKGSEKSILLGFSNWDDLCNFCNMTNIRLVKK